MIQISLDHVDLIKIGQQRTVCGFQWGGPSSGAMVTRNRGGPAIG
jgi:hypothetical protein